MKKFGYFLALSLMLSCNAQSGTGSSKSDSTGTDKKPVDATTMSSSSGCGNSLLFHKGVIIEGATYDGNGKQTSSSVATVTDVTEAGGATIAQISSRLKKDGQAEDKPFTTSYKCDGQNLTVDMSGMMSGGTSKVGLETSGISFPINVIEGETLPDATYTLVMNTKSKEIKATSHVTQRKVEAKEPITIDGGTYTCYKISSVIDVATEIAGMDEKTKQMMETMKAKLPKNRMIIWYAPDATVMKMEYYQGDKLISKNEVTKITKP